MMTRLLARAMARMRSMSAGKPKRCTGIIARVLGVMAASSSAGLRLKVAGSRCKKTRLADSWEGWRRGAYKKKKGVKCVRRWRDSTEGEGKCWGRGTESRARVTD